MSSNPGQTDCCLINPCEGVVRNRLLEQVTHWFVTLEIHSAMTFGLTSLQTQQFLQLKGNKHFWVVVLVHQRLTVSLCN